MSPSVHGDRKGHGKCKPAVQAVRGAAHSRVIGPQSHFDPVVDRLVVGPVPDQPDWPPRGHSGSWPQRLWVVPTIRLARVIHPCSSVVVVVDEGAARRLHVADATAGAGSEGVRTSRSSDAVVGEQFENPLGRVDQFNESCPVIAAGWPGQGDRNARGTTSSSAWARGVPMWSQTLSRARVFTRYTPRGADGSRENPSSQDSRHRPSCRATRQFAVLAQVLARSPIRGKVHGGAVRPHQAQPARRKAAGCRARPRCRESRWLSLARLVRMAA